MNTYEAFQYKDNIVKECQFLNFILLLTVGLLLCLSIQASIEIHFCIFKFLEKKSLIIAYSYIVETKMKLSRLEKLLCLYIFLAG